MFDGIGVPEIILILVIIMIFFGVGKLPDVATGLGKAVKNFRKAQRGDLEEEEKAPIPVKGADKVAKRLQSSSKL